MRTRVRHYPAAVHPAKSLAVRAGLVRTFGGLATFLALTFLCSGIYTLQDAFAHPLAAQAPALIFGAFSIALAIILLYYLIKPGNKPKRIRPHPPRHDASRPEPEFLGELSESARQDDDGKDLVYQRVYVDHSRIRI
jgi:hypothetical protein